MTTRSTDQPLDVTSWDAFALLVERELIAELGGGRVEGYPEPAGALPAGFLFNGTRSTFEQAGFDRQRMIGKHRWVNATEIPPSRD